MLSTVATPRGWVLRVTSPCPEVGSSSVRSCRILRHGLASGYSITLRSEVRLLSWTRPRSSVVEQGQGINARRRLAPVSQTGRERAGLHVASRPRDASSGCGSVDLPVPARPPASASQRPLTGPARNPGSTARAESQAVPQTFANCRLGGQAARTGGLRVRPKPVLSTPFFSLRARMGELADERSARRAARKPAAPARWRSHHVDLQADPSEAERARGRVP